MIFMETVVTYPEFCHRNSQWSVLEYFNIFSDFHEVYLWTTVIQCLSLPNFFVVFFDQFFTLFFEHVKMDFFGLCNVLT